MKFFGVTAPTTGSGKTIITLALLKKLNNATALKIGPDYIDAMLSQAITGTTTHNIDRWLQGSAYKYTMCNIAQKYAYAVIEGVMGFYDSGTELDLSTHYYFTKLKVPYILVVDVSKVAESAYYYARGFMNKYMVGVILNKYSSEKHLNMVEKPFKQHHVKIIGKVPYSKSIKIPERHLGLYTRFELTELENIAKHVAEYIDFSFVETLPEFKCKHINTVSMPQSHKKIYIALDKAFNFYYGASIEALKMIGEVQYFSPLNNEVPDNADFIYLGGGYPELYADILAKNTKTLEYIRAHSASGLPVLAECGGLMYLENILETDHRVYHMAGVFPGTVHKTKKLTLGYTKLKVLDNSLLFKKGEIVYGHEFHYSTITDHSPKTMVNIRGVGIDGRDGVKYKLTFGSYSHFYIKRYIKRIAKVL